jgi:hypothetical protein
MNVSWRTVIEYNAERQLSINHQQVMMSDLGTMLRGRSARRDRHGGCGARRPQPTDDQGLPMRDSAAS